MALGPHGRKLACDLIKDQFGDIVQQVCDCLVNRGHLPLSDIARFTGISIPQLRDCLLVLIQHNCVQAFKVAYEAGAGLPPKTQTCYLAIVDSILHRMRFPKFLLLVQDDLGKEAEALVSGLLEHGRLTLEQLIHRGAEWNQSAELDIAKTLRETLIQLVRCRYIERCPIAEPLLGAKSDDEPPKKKVTRGKGKLFIVAETQEQKVLAAAALMDAERFRIPASIADGGPPTVDEDIHPTAQKRKHSALEMDASTSAIVDEKEVAWRVNYEDLVRRLRHQACVAQIRSKIDAGCGDIMAAILSATRNSESKVKERVSDALSVDDIMTALRTSSLSMTMGRVRDALKEMTSIGFVSRAGEGSNQYVVNMQKILECARQAEVEGIVLQRFGRNCCRIFRLLATKGLLEHKQISNMILVPPKETWELLYKLLKDGYVEIQEVTKAPADHAPSRTFYLWRVNTTAVEQCILDDMCHACYNLMQRLSYEIEQEHEVISLLQKIQESKSNVSITSKQQEQANKIRNVAAVLETSLLQLDDAVLLFHDF